MTDHRITDLSFGILGKPSFDIELGEWSFSRDVALEQTIKPLLPLKEHLSASTIAHEESGHISHKERDSLKAVRQAYPELHSAIGIASTFFSSSTERPSDFQEGSLFSIGRAVDHGRLSGSATPLIFALPYGDASHILRIVRPRIEKRGWGKDSGAALSVFVTESCDEAYYKIGTEGAIRQVTFANEDVGSGTWLAVRQNSITTISRVVYTGSDEWTTSSNNVSCIRPSNLRLSSVVVLPAKRSASTSHSDVTFNPMYTRQIGVVDASGRWSIWDIEGQHGRSSSLRLAPGKAGAIYDNYAPDPALKLPDFGHTDGWHRILWACNVTTILICNRHHLAVFDLKSNPTRLDSTDFMVAKGFDLILDMKRSPSNANHIFILTTSRIFWVKVSPAREDEHDISGGAKVVLSYQHFRDGNDKTMRLAVVKDDYVSVLIYSRENRIINFYCFSAGSNIVQRQSAQGSFLLSTDSDQNGWKPLKSAYFLPMSLALRSFNNSTRPELRYPESVRFLQLWIFTTGLGLSSTLCAVQADTDRQMDVSAPTSKISQSLRRGGSRYITQSLIVPNGTDGYDNVEVRKSPLRNYVNDYLMNWSRIFQTAFLSPSCTSDTSTNTSMLLTDLLYHILKGSEEDKFTMGTLLEFSGLASLSENLEQVTENLGIFLDSLPEAFEDGSDLVISDLTGCPGLEILTGETPKSRRLIKIYEQLADKWMASLPLKVSNASRGSKFKIIRQIAVDICFSSITISRQNKSSKISATLPQKRDEVLEITGKSTTRESSPATFYSSHTSVAQEQDSEFGLPTTIRTPSINSNATSVSELAEDPAISRLRQYAISIKSRPDFEQSKLLSEWPSSPGIDPATYLYTSPATDDSDGDSRKARREAAKRKKRTERFLLRNIEASSQISVATFVSQQPEASHPEFSSQTVEDLPMTQPDRGAFESRSVKSKKKQKKHRAAGF